MLDQASTSHRPEYLPPKFPSSDTAASNKISRTILSLVLYLAAAYWLLGDVKNILLITLVLIFHEAGHFLAMRQVGYRDLSIFFLPLIGAYVSGTKRVITQKESAIVLLAGPMPGILVGCTLFFGIQQGFIPPIGPFGLNLKMFSIFLILLNGFNLLPVYPWDGGQLLNRVFLDEEGLISKIFVILSTLLLGFFAIAYRIYPLLIFPLAQVWSMWRDAANQRIEKRIELAAIQTEIDYEELPDEDYWRIRKILMEEQPSIRALAGEHIWAYAPQEETIRQAVEGQLHRTLVQDLSVFAKCLILLIWLIGLLTPIWLWLS